MESSIDLVLAIFLVFFFLLLFYLISQNAPNILAFLSRLLYGAPRKVVAINSSWIANFTALLNAYRAQVSARPWLHAPL